MSKKPFIFFCDDRLQETESFKERHGKEFEVETINSFDKFMEKLRELIKQKRIPDIIIADHSQENTADKNELAKCHAVGKKLLEEIEKVRIICKPFYDPSGIKLLEEVRKLKECKDIPFAIYTKYGLIFEASNDDFQKVAENKGEWIRKGESKLYEESRLYQMLNDRNNMLAVKRYADTTKKVLWTFSAIIFLTALIYSYLTKHDLINTLTFGITLTSFLLALMPYIIKQSIGKENQF